MGKPISNTSLYILNEGGNVSPIGVFGEIYIGGVGLARGYYNNPDLTSTKFIFKSINGFEQRLYKTGDLGRWLPDGNVEFSARVDDQVKIRGHRIELGEIENVLLQSPDVEKALVVVRDDKQGHKALVGYVVMKNFDKHLLVSFLKSKLPEYMVPNYWVKLELVPLSSNGKIDKNALPLPQFMEELSDVYVAPNTAVESKLVEIWKELIGVQQIGIDDNFFELGGHSLLAMRMVSYIETSFSISIPINVLFQSTTIRGLAKYLELQLDNSLPEKNTSKFELLDV